MSAAAYTYLCLVLTPEEEVTHDEVYLPYYLTGPQRDRDPPLQCRYSDNRVKLWFKHTALLPSPTLAYNCNYLDFEVPYFNI